MCGIAGFYGFRDDTLIRKFSLELAHRGPDGEGYDIDDRVTLLNRRLAIIDVKGGDQPIFNEDKTISIVFVGEIYNYQELTDRLQKAGHRFSTKSDTEMIIHAYEEWGEKSFDRFNGMFTFALYDKKKKKLILARDHFGIKPLYFTHITTKEIKNGLIFSSELKPILNSGLIKKKPNDRVIYRYLKFRIHDDGEETFFKGIYRLMPGQMMIIKNGNLRLEQFSNLEQELKNATGNTHVNGETIRGFSKELIQAIRLRLISEVPVGSCLSGGLDSSTVVAVINTLLKEKVKEASSVGKIQNTFSAIFPQQGNDEEKYMDELIKTTNVKSYKIAPKPEEFFRDITDFVRTQEEPTISTGPYAQYQVMSLAHKKVTVVLDGQGSDEIMAGYIPYYVVYWRQLWRQKNILKLLAELLQSTDILFLQLEKQVSAIAGMKKSLRADQLLNAGWTEKFHEEQFSVTSDNLKKRLVEDIFHNSLQSLLRYEDRNAMRFSIEGRVPFLDFNLVRYIFTLDDGAIIRGGWNKYVLREATRELLPELINRRRNKIGFTTPEYEWFMRMKNKIYAIFLSESFARRKYFNQSTVLHAFQLFIEGKVDDTMVFWRLLNLELWLREFIDTPVNEVHKVIKFEKKEYGPNEGKKLEINVNRKKYIRFPIKTDLFKKGDNYAEKIAKYTTQFINELIVDKKWFIVVSEKIVAISQGRSYFIWDIKPSVWANILSKFVTRTPFGIGLGSPWTMQLAIQEVGLERILLATVSSVLTKPFGLKGIFYQIAGPIVRSIDGPTEYSLYPSNVSAKLGPKEPQQVAENVKLQITNYKSISNFKFPLQGKQISNFLGVVIIDANDIGRNVLGNSTGLDDRLIEEIMKDNPMGQADEQTPLVLVTVKSA